MKGIVICWDAKMRFIGRQRLCAAKSGMTSSRNRAVPRPTDGSVIRGSHQKAEAQKKPKGTVCNLKASESPHGVPDFFFFFWLLWLTEKKSLLSISFGGGGCSSMLGAACLACVCAVGDDADGDVDAADAAVIFNVADDQAVDDAVDNVVHDDKEADGDISIITINSSVTNSFSNSRIWSSATLKSASSAASRAPSA